MSKFLSYIFIFFTIVGATLPDPQVVAEGTPTPPVSEGPGAVHGGGTGAVASTVE